MPHYPNPTQFVWKTIPNGSAVDGDCCVCCGRTTILPARVSPVSIDHRKRMGPNSYGATCYCNCSACYPDGDLHFHTLGCLKEISLGPGAGFGYLPCDGTMSFDLKRGGGDAEYCFHTQKTANILDTKAACRSVDVDGLDDYWSVVYTPEAGEGIERYPEAWGYSGKVCTDRAEIHGHIPERPSSNWPEGRGEPGMEVIASLCCCKISTWAQPKQNVHGEGKLVPASGGDVGPLPANCQPVSHFRATPEQGGPTASSACPSLGHSADDLIPEKEILSEPQGADPLLNRRYECSIPCFTFTIQPNPVNTGSYLILDQVAPGDWDWIKTGYVASPCSKDIWRLGQCQGWPGTYDPGEVSKGRVDANKLEDSGGADWAMQSFGAKDTNETTVTYGGQHTLMSGQCPDGRDKHFMLLIGGSWDSHCDCATGVLSPNNSNCVGGGEFDGTRIRANDAGCLSAPSHDYPDHPEQPGGWVSCAANNLKCQEEDRSLCEEYGIVEMFFSGLIQES